MNIIESLNALQTRANEFAESYCIVNGAVMPLAEIHSMGYDEFALRSKINMPLRLYRYYPNIVNNDTHVNYSLQALRDNTVYLQSPTLFDDVYDSDISIDYPVYFRARLFEFCKRAGIHMKDSSAIEEAGTALASFLWNYAQSNTSLEYAICTQSENELENGSNRIFCLRIEKDLRNGKDWGFAINNAITQEYTDYCDSLKNTFRTVCFATTPYSQLMWGGSYADYHRGFCIEYTIQPHEKEYETVYYNLFPMIYCKVRPDMTQRLIDMKDKEVTKESIWDIYSHGALRKSIDWAFQNEWRLLLPLRSKSPSDYNVKFFPITKVFLGNRMPAHNRREIIDICHAHSIPYVGVKRKADVFEMEDCETKCEDCPRFTL